VGVDVGTVRASWCCRPRCRASISNAVNGARTSAGNRRKISPRTRIPRFREVSHPSDSGDQAGSISTRSAGLSCVFMFTSFHAGSGAQSPCRGWERVRFWTGSGRLAPFRAVSVEIRPFRSGRSHRSAVRLSCDCSAMMWLPFRSVLPPRCARVDVAVLVLPHRFGVAAVRVCARRWRARMSGAGRRAVARRVFTRRWPHVG
jgi:hypothetical protein